MCFLLVVVRSLSTEGSPLLSLLLLPFSFFFLLFIRVYMLVIDVVDVGFAWSLDFALLL